MTTNRRDVIKGTLALAGRSAVFSGGMGVAGTLISCGGGGGSSAPSIAAPSALSYTSPAQATVGTAITAMSPTVTGTVTSYAVSPALPAGLSLNTTTGVISGTPTAAAVQTMYTITATNAGGNTTFTLSLTVNKALAISSVSSTQPTALTPVSIVTAGLDTTQPFTITLAFDTINSTALTPIRTGNDGTLLIAMPLNVDPMTGISNGYSAGLSLTQGSQTTAPTPLTVQDIPSLASYGTTLGQISHAFYNYLAISHGRIINQLQAISANHSAVDTSATRAALSTTMLNALHARSDVDRVIANNSLRIPAGLDASGATLYFTQASVEMLDRMFGFYLTELQAPVAAAVAGTALVPNNLNRMRRAGAGTHVSGTAPTPLNLLTSVLGGTITANLGVASAISNATSRDTNTNGLTATLDATSAILFGATKYLAVAGILTGGTTDVAAAFTGAAGATCAMVSDLIKSYNSQEQILQLQANGGSQAALTAAIAARDAAFVSVATDAVGGILSAFPASKGLNEIVNTNLAANVVYQGSALVATIVGLSADGIGTQIANSTGAGNQLTTVAPDAQHGFADLTGTCSITNSNAGTILPGLYEANLSIVGMSSTMQLNSITDGSGNFDVLVPLGDATLNYSSSILDIQDPSTGSMLGSEPLDLSSLTSLSGDTIPVISGMCTDVDASTPDGDDPDCD